MPPGVHAPLRMRLHKASVFRVALKLDSGLIPAWDGMLAARVLLMPMRQGSFSMALNRACFSAVQAAGCSCSCA